MSAQVNNPVCSHCNVRCPRDPRGFCTHCGKHKDAPVDVYCKAVPKGPVAPQLRQ